MNTKKLKLKNNKIKVSLLKHCIKKILKMDPTEMTIKSMKDRIIQEFSETKVVNVKVEYIRPKGNKNYTLKDWMSEKNNIYIARRGIVFIKDEKGDKKRFPEKDSIWANPFKITKEDNRNTVILKYEEYIRKKLKENPKLVDELLLLKGKNLGCWCHPEPCHGDILVKLIEEYK